jgi:hypothetical protein
VDEENQVVVCVQQKAQPVAECETSLMAETQAQRVACVPRLSPQLRSSFTCCWELLLLLLLVPRWVLALLRVPQLPAVAGLVAPASAAAGA